MTGRNTRRMAYAAAVAGITALPFAAPATAGAPGQTLEVDTTNDSVDVAPGDGECADAQGACSLRAAVQEANASGGGEIELRGGAAYVLRLTGAGEDGSATGDLDVLARISVDGNGAGVDAGGIDRAFDVRAGASLEVDDLTVTGGAPPSGESGGGFRSVGSLVLDRSRVTGNVAEGTGASGGGVFNDGGSLQVGRSTLDDNSATRAGGGIEANAGTTSVDRSTLSRNATGPGPGNGGGLHLTGTGTVTVERSTVDRNTASAEGGGLWNSATGTMLVSRTELTGNVASGDAADQGGGGLFNDGGELTVVRSEIRGNVADGTSGSGGGILNDGGVLDVDRSVLDGNTASRAGGGIEADVGTTTLTRTTLSGNSTGPNPGNGGGLHLTGAGEVTIDRGVVVGNDAANEGGGLWNSATGTMTVTDTRIRGNTAPVGPDVFNLPPGGDFTIDGAPVPPG